MSLKKILLTSFLLVIIPTLILKCITTKEELNINYTTNQQVRVKQVSKDIIVTVSLEEYVEGVLSGEMPVYFNIEALKAQAVAARSYVFKKIEYSTTDYDVVDTTDHQVYLDNTYLKSVWKDNYIENINKIRQAVYETEGQVITYNDEVIEAFFFSTSTGATENSEDVFIEALPYLRSVSSLWDKDVSPVFKEDTTFSLTEFYNRLNLPYNDTITQETLSATGTGRIKKIKINDQTFTGTEVLQKLNIRSNCFTIKQDNENVYVTTKGFGHGVGMSQYGAEGMAQKGYKYDEIIKHYYQGTEIKNLKNLV